MNKITVKHYSKDGNFTVVLPASLNQSAIDLLASGKWKTYLTV